MWKGRKKRKKSLNRHIVSSFLAQNECEMSFIKLNEKNYFHFANAA